MRKTQHVFVLICLIQISNSANAQLKVHSSGNVILGEITQTPTSLLEISGNTENIEISNSSETEAGIIFYDRGYETSQYGKMLFNSYGNDLNFYINGTSYDMKLTPSGNLFIAGTLYQYSDSSVKTNIKLIENEFNNIYNLSAYKYTLKSEEEQVLSDNNEPLFNEKNAHIKHYGFIAQELKEVYPELVIEGNNSELSVDYISVIPLLVEALKEQKREIEELKFQIADLSASTKKSQISELNICAEKALGVYTEQTMNAVLYQNVPNPFNRTTTIKYNIPELKGDASINVYDLRGKQLQSYMINQPDEGTIEIESSVLHPGIYLYNLIVEGYIVDSKQMVLTD